MISDDDELAQIFIEEAHDILEAINGHLEKWQGSDKELLVPILRELHTLKGSTRMMGLAGVSEYLHCLEQIIQKVYEGEILPQENVFKEIQAAVDYLNAYIELFLGSQARSDSEIPISPLKNLLNTSQTIFPEKAQKEFIQPDRLKEKTPPKHGQSYSEVIRIKSDLLEKFGNLSSQINIARSHLEQQFGPVNRSLSEMTKEIKLIQEQMRHVQAKADVHLRMFQNQTIEKKYEEFDVLELDRYTSLQHALRVLEDKLNQLDELNAFSVGALRSMEGILIAQGRAAKSLEEGITHIRMVSIDHLVPRLSKIALQVSQELGKKVRVECLKAQGEIDRKILEKLISPLEHMLRNAIDHGIEPPEVRRQKGKPEYGVITLSLFRRGNEIVIELGDDGQGIDEEKVKEKAIEKKIWDPRLPMSKTDLLQVISLPGFSTKEEVTPISGRGVGIDVVNTEVSRLGGTLMMDTQRNWGTQFTIHLPFTLSLNQALILIAGKQLYAIPLSNLSGVTRISIKEMQEKLKTGDNTITYAKTPYKFFYLAELLGDGEWKKLTKLNVLPVILLQSESNRVGLVIDKLVGSHEIVIKPAGTQLKFVKEISGVSLMGDGKIALILNPQILSQRAFETVRESKLSQRYQEKIKVLIVDDSATVRQVTGRLLKRHHYEALSAKDGIEAFEVMEENLPDIVLLDIEMPRMDGFKMVESMRENSKFKNIPVIMITSRSGEKHRLKAMRSGADAYLSKPYREAELLTLLEKFKPCQKKL